MKKTLHIFLVLFTFSEGISQINLVPNPSFEEKTRCPEGYPDLDGVCNDWMSFRGSPDYFHNCSSMNGYNNNWGYQEPHSGEAYAGIITFAKTGANPPLTREYLGIQLSTTITIGEKYFVSFFVSTAWDDVNMNIATDKIGALFTTYSFEDPLSNHPINNFAHIWSETIISDTVIWTKISSEFVADSAYKYLIIGNFFDDFNTDTLNLPIKEGFPTNQAAFYYIDDICVSTDSIYCENWTNLSIETSSSIFNVFPNPSSDFVKLTTKNLIQNIELYNSAGQKILTEVGISNNSYSIDVRDIEKGIYLLNINGVQFKKIVIN